jgi:hypothetical protein
MTELAYPETTRLTHLGRRPSEALLRALCLHLRWLLYDGQVAPDGEAVLMQLGHLNKIGKAPGIIRLRLEGVRDARPGSLRICVYRRH